MPSISWNPEVKLILSDVDETIADLYIPAVPEMHQQLITLLEEGKTLFFVTGQGLKSVQSRIIDFIPQPLRTHIFVGHCGGAEVWGHDQQGLQLSQPFYSVYEEQMTAEQKDKWRDIIKEIVAEFKLETHPTTPVKEFLAKAGNNPLAIMLEDRGPQITFEVINGYDLSLEQVNELTVAIPETHGAYDLRIPILERADQLFQQANIPVAPKLGGVFAVDFMVKGVSKKTAVQYILNNNEILASVGLSKNDLSNPLSIEIWGDKFSTIRGGSDRYMSEAVSPEVRSIDFRQENPEEFEKGYNIMLWDGQKHLHEGTLEYLQSKQQREST